MLPGHHTFGYEIEGEPMQSNGNFTVLGRFEFSVDLEAVTTYIYNLNETENKVTMLNETTKASVTCAPKVIDAQ